MTIDAINPVTGDVVSTHEEMTAAALSGFSNAYALFVHVLPGASAMTPAAVSATALTMKLPACLDSVWTIPVVMDSLPC